MRGVNETTAEDSREEVIAVQAKADLDAIMAQDGIIPWSPHQQGHYLKVRRRELRQRAEAADSAR